jgi:branched-chain amino acid transport system substrate-binding protein
MTWRLLRAVALVAFLVGSLGLTAEAGAETVKIGVLLPYTGPFAAIAQQMDDGIKMYMEQHANELGGHSIEILRRDTTGAQPDIAKRLAQELLTRDHVQILTGFVFTPNALAVAPLASETKTPLIIMNAATGLITTRSPYIARTSFALWQTDLPLGTWAATTGGIKSVYTIVSDFAAGIDAEQAFVAGYTEAGGAVVGSLRIPLVNPDYAPFLQRILDAHPDAIFVWQPPTSATAFMKAVSDLGLARGGIRVLGDNVADEAQLQQIGDAALGVVTAQHYTPVLKNPENLAFAAAWHAMHGPDSDPTYVAVGAWDGMALIFHLIRTLDGKIGGDRAMEVIKSYQAPSPRGPFRIDPETRDAINDIYIRRVERVDGRLVNAIIDTIPAVKDPWKQRNKP